MAGQLRFGLDHLWPSEIAGQLYCEQKVHLTREHPELLVELPGAEWGETCHAELFSQAEPITPQEIDSAIAQGKKLALCEWTLEGTLQGVSIRGRPDFFAFQGKNARILLDFKFNNLNRPFPNQEFQVAIYALLAEQLGFRCDRLCLGVVKFPRLSAGGTLEEVAQAKADALHALQADGTLHTVLEQCEQGRVKLFQNRTTYSLTHDDRWAIHLFHFNRAKWEAELARALAYWKQEREPLPETRHARKCFVCACNAAGLCSKALMEPDPAFAIQPRPDGTIVVSRSPAGEPRLGLPVLVSSAARQHREIPVRSVRLAG